MKTSVALSIVGVGIAIAVFSVQSIHYQSQIDKLQQELADAQVRNTILQADLKECKKIESSIKAKHDKMLAELLADFNKNFKKGGK